MRFNGEHIKVYTDKHGPYDGYLHKGCILSNISDKYTVTKAFDYQGAHYGIVRKYHNAKFKAICALIPLMIIVSVLLVRNYKNDTVYCVISRPTEFVVNSDGQVELKITNKSPEPLYINVNGVEHMLGTNETLFSVPYVSTPFTILYTYKGHVYEEEVTISDS